MKTLKGFILFIIALCTALAILYLIFQAKKLEQYTGAIDYSDKCYILYSSDGGELKDAENISNILSFAADFLKQSGTDAAAINETQKEKIKSKIMDLMKKDKKYILIDINPTKLILSENTVLIRLGKKENPKYESNLEYALKLKEAISNKYKNLKVNTLTDSKYSYNQDMGHTAIRLEISESLTCENAKTLTSYILEILTQLE